MHTPSPEVSGYDHEEAYDSGFLSVGDNHEVWYGQYGSRDGIPVIFLHGGPGGGTSIANTAFFDPKAYRVVLMDQRGAGKSTPSAGIHKNTTQDLVENIEKLRKHLQIEQWSMVFGGSWGSTLALVYAQTYPQATKSLVLRGVFTVRQSELANGFAPYGVPSQLFPEAYHDLVEYLRSNSAEHAGDLANPHDVLSGYYRLLCHEDPEIRNAASRAWNLYEVLTSSLRVNQQLVQKVEEDVDWNLQHARIECHYFMHGAWLEDGLLLSPESLDRIKHIRCDIVQGRYDVVCPPRTAWELHRGLPESRLHIIPDAGHSANESGIKAKLIEVCDEIAKL